VVVVVIVEVVVVIVVVVDVVVVAVVVEVFNYVACTVGTMNRRESERQRVRGSNSGKFKRFYPTFCRHFL
jgi:hypothetical protein